MPPLLVSNVLPQVWHFHGVIALLLNISDGKVIWSQVGLRAVRPGSPALFLLLRFLPQHDRKHSGNDEPGNAYPNWDKHAVYRDLPMKKKAKKMHDGDN
jgi:hypothetical protein